VKHRTQGYYAALKALDRASQNPEKQRKSLLFEIDIHGSLVQENVVRLFTYFEDTSFYYLLMEYCDRGELYNSIQMEKK
jgi:serine/threonine protein kinase